MHNLFQKIIITVVLINPLFFNYALSKEPVDHTITQELNNLISKESDLPHEKLKIITKNRVIILSGSVETRLQADKIVELANSIGNVKDVDTYNLRVTNSKQYFKDALITSAVKGRVSYLTRTNKIEKNKIHVETTNGNVHLFGWVGNEEDISIIQREIQRIKGVKNVYTNLEEKI